MWAQLSSSVLSTSRLSAARISCLCSPTSSRSGPSDMIAAVEAPNVAEMDALIDEIGALAGVERTNSSIVLATKFDR